jgi:methylenetetrahydrofolate reductase (NADPH)
MCRDILTAGHRGIHLYTMNLEKASIDILTNLGFITRVDTTPRLTPWRPAGRKEDVRPIFWSNRPKSYIDRTATWDEFPNGRWGHSESPAFGEVSNYHLKLAANLPCSELRQLWGATLTSEQDVWTPFTRYCSGEISLLPWNDRGLDPESQLINKNLIRLNSKGFLTTNSQPSVNGQSSSDPLVGWGPAGGYVYQKAYLEFFTSRQNMEKLLGAISKFPTLSMHAVDSKGVAHTVNADNVNAVTWGVFPNSEVLQPTVVDPTSFVVWKDEAFALWKSKWAAVYGPDQELPSYVPDKGSSAIIDLIVDTYFLVNLVENDFTTPNKIMGIFDAIITS